LPLKTRKELGLWLNYVSFFRKILYFCPPFKNGDSV
jgi:hypothetical protein